jgi:hypothetical protein
VLPALRLAMIERLHRSCPELTTPSHHLLAEVITRRYTITAAGGDQTDAQR